MVPECLQDLPLMRVPTVDGDPETVDDGGHLVLGMSGIELLDELRQRNHQEGKLMRVEVDAANLLLAE